MLTSYGSHIATLMLTFFITRKDEETLIENGHVYIDNSAPSSTS